MKLCARCHCVISRYAAAHERYCIVCHPKPEKRPRLCAHGHDLHLHGEANGRGRLRCALCRRSRERITA